MKSLALMVKHKKELEWIKQPFQIPWDKKDIMFKKLTSFQEKMSTIFQDYVVDRVYYGNEFCEFLLPSLEELTGFIQEAQKFGVKVTLLTPIMTDFGLEKLIPLLYYLNTEHPGSEVVCNDWGVVLLLKEEFTALQCVSGRLLNRMVKDPRLGVRDYEQFFSSLGLEYLKQTNLTASSFRQVLAQYQIRRVEIDLTPQGIAQEMTCAGGQSSIPVSLYFPFSYVTSGRYCLTQALNKPLEHKFDLSDKTCQKNCQELDIIMSKQIEPLLNELDDEQLWKIELYRKGNTVFYLNPRIEDLFEQMCFDRLIYQPAL